MPATRSFHWSKADLFWISVSLIVLLVSLFYAYYSQFPDYGFEVNAGWSVVRAESCPPGARCVRVGDRVQAIGDLTYDRFRRERSAELFGAFTATGSALVHFKRREQAMQVVATIRPWRLRPEFLVILFPVVFWLMGTVVVIFLRPRDERWLVLTLFAYLTAIWFSSGLASPRHARGSAVVFHAFIWLALPLFVHLHTIVPSPLFHRGRRALIASLYGGALVFAVLDALYLLRHGLRYAPFASFMLGLVASLALLLLRLFLPGESAVKVATRIMLFGVALGFGPLILLYFFLPQLASFLAQTSLGIETFNTWALAIGAISIPILPASYIYAIYKHYLGALEFRANRLLSVYSFFSLYITIYVLSILIVSSLWAPINSGALVAISATSLFFVASAPLLRGRFQSLVDHHVFGIRHSPEEVVALVAERVPAAFDRAVLSRVIVEEILPTLLIRQSALYLFRNAHHEVLYEQALPDGGGPAATRPDTAELRSLLAVSGRYLRAPAGEEAPGCPAWVRLIVPLSVKAETIGVWLIGRRDPDDYYPADDIKLLSTVANQIATVVENIGLYERAQREIAQRKLAELEIRRSEERFRHLFEATLEGIALVRGGDILEVNQALLAIFGYAPGELIGRRLADLVTEGEEELTGVPREGLGRMREGETVDIELAGKKYVFQGEDVTVVAIRDIGRRKRNEAENRMLQAQLLHSQKMEAIGRLSAGVAHDFNNCLLAIFGYSDLLLGTYRDDLFLSRNLTGIKDAGQKAATLTKQLLAFTRQQPMEAKVMDLNVVVSGLEKMLQRLVGDDVALGTDLEPDIALVKIDPGQMEQVLMNLAVNARHAMPKGGHLSILTLPVVITPGAPAHHADVPAGTWVLLVVGDTGIGMDAETQARIFEPFFSTKGLGEGTGLGLSTAYGIVKQSGGYIFVDSIPGQGATFSIYLPASGEREATAAVGAAAGPDDTGSETILLVEDEDEVRALLRQMLVDKGYRVLQAASAEEALAILALPGRAFDLLLTDVIMPKTKGTELAAQLLASRPDLRVIFMSGYNEEPLLAGDGAPICLQKPFSSRVLARAIRTALDDEEPAEAMASGVA